MGNFVIAKYIRLSIEDAKTDSMSVEGQRSLLDKHIAGLDFPDTTVLEFVDNGYSGTNFERPAVQEMLELVRQGKVNCIIVKDFSRFGRTAIETGYFVERVFPLYGTRFISVCDVFDSDEHEGHTGGMEVAFKFIVYEHYSRDLSEKIKAAKHEKMRRGEFVTKNCVFGFMLNKSRKMVVDSPAAKTVQMIFSLAAQGKSLSEIKRHLYDKKRPTPSEHKRSLKGAGKTKPACIWHEASILSILRNEQYIGTYVAGKTKVVSVGSSKTVRVKEDDWVRIADHHTVIVAKAVFYAAREQLGSRARLVVTSCKRRDSAQKRYVNAIDTLLKSKVYCGCCNHLMKPSATRNSKFHCSYTRAISDAACHLLSILVSGLNDMVLKAIQRKVQTALGADGLAGLDSLAVKSEQQARHEKLISQAEDEKVQLYERFVLGEITADEYKTAKAELDTQIAALTRAHEVLSKDVDGLAEASKSREVIVSLADVHAAGELTGPMVDVLIDRVLVFPGGNIEISWKIPMLVA